jgi:site-specific DNA-cytosine methylase
MTAEIKRAKDLTADGRDLVAERGGAKSRMKLARRAAPAATLRTLEYDGAQSRMRHRRRRRETVRTCADDR